MCLKVDVSVTLSCLTLSNYMDCRLCCSWNSPGKNKGVAFQYTHFLLQGSNLGLPYCRQIFHYLSHQGSSTDAYIYMYLGKFYLI